MDRGRAGSHGAADQPYRFPRVHLHHRGAGVSTIVSAAVYPLQMPPVAKAVLVSMADNANDEGECWPSISTICMRTCYGKTAVIDAIKWLEQEGMIVAERGPRGTGTIYTILAGRVNDMFVRPTSPPDGLVRRGQGRPGWAKRSATRTSSAPPAPPKAASGELFGRETPPNQSASRTSPAGEPVRDADQGSPSGEPDQSASRTWVVRQADPNHQEPPVTISDPSSAQARDDDEPEPMDPAEVERVLEPFGGIPDFVPREWLARFVRHRASLRRVVSGEGWMVLRQQLRELHAAGHSVADSLRQTIGAGLHIPVIPKTAGARAGPNRPRANDDFTDADYQGTDDADIPAHLRNTG